MAKTKTAFVWRPKNLETFEQVKLLAEFIECKPVTDLIDDWAAAAVAQNADKLRRMMEHRAKIVEIAAEPDDKPAAATPQQNFSAHLTPLDVIQLISKSIPDSGGDIRTGSGALIKQALAYTEKQSASELDEQTEDASETSAQSTTERAGDLSQISAEGGVDDE